MSVNPVNAPVPPNSNYVRSMFVWGAINEINNDNKKQDLLDHCEDHGINVLFLDIWGAIGGSNWSTNSKNNLAEFIDAAHQSGIQVHALAGNVDWGGNHSWVAKNILQPIAKYQAMHNSSFPKSLFDGLIFDVEYWTNETSYPPSTHLPGLLDLVDASRHRLNIPVGVFAAFYLKDDNGNRSDVSYRGKSAQDGEHMMDHCDYVVVGAYRDSASAQIDLFDPWYDYASGSGKNHQLYCGLETINISPSYITYYGDSKSSMESEQTTVSNQFQVTGNSVFLGAAIHNYDGHKAMS